VIKIIITISGKPGSGKSTVAKTLAEKLNLKHYSTGDFRRKLAVKNNLDINELNKLGEKEFWTDRQADDWQTNLGETKDNFIIDSRLGFHFIPNSIKIFLSVSKEVGADRIFKEGRTEEKFKNLKEAEKFWAERTNSDSKRYKKYYNINPYDKNNYDIIIDTTNMTKEEAVKKVLEFIRLKNQEKR